MKRHKQLTGQQSVPVSLHIKELRNRFFWVAGFFVAGGVLGYYFQVAIIAFLNRYIEGNLYYTSPAGNFNFIMKVAVLTGVLFAIPIATYQIIKFTQPALKAYHQYKRTWFVALLALVLALTGMAFAMWIIVPMSLHFFAGFNINGVQPLISADEYLNYVMKALLWFAILFQIPLLMLFINKIMPLKPRRLLKYEKFVVIAALVIALILPFTYDPVTQFIIAVPIVLLYNISILLIWLSNRSDIKQAAKQQFATKTYQFNQAKNQTPKTLVLVDKPVTKQRLQPSVPIASTRQHLAKPAVTKARVVSDFGFAPKSVINQQIKPANNKKQKQQIEQPTPRQNQPPHGLSMDMVLPTS